MVQKHAAMQLRRLFFAVFVFVFALVFMNITMGNGPLNYNTVQVLIFIIGWATLFMTASIFLFRPKAELFKYEWIQLLIIFIMVFIVQMIFGRALETYPIYDFGALYHGAVEWIRFGELRQNADYFHQYHNNQGSLLFLTSIFSIANLVGITDFYLVGTVLNALLIDGSFFLVYLICRRQFGQRQGMLALLLCILCIPMYFSVPIFYTDTLSMLFFPFTYYLYLLGKDADRTVKKIVYYFLMGLVCAIGTLIKATVIIVLIAIFIDIFLSKKLIRNFVAALVAVVPMILVSVLSSAYLYSSVLNKDEAEIRGFPTSQWIMMGMGYNGAYNFYDYEYMLQFNSMAERDLAAKTVIKERLEEHGVLGYTEFLFQKGAHNFGGGEFGIYHFLDDNPQHDTLLHEFGLLTGKYFDFFTHLTQGYHIALFIFIIQSARLMLRRKENMFASFVSYLSIFGVFLFLLIWEANPRYIQNYFPMFVLAAIPALEHNAIIIRKRYQRKKRNHVLTQ